MHYLLDVFFRQRHPGSDLKENVFFVQFRVQILITKPSKSCTLEIDLNRFPSGLSRHYQRVRECSVTAV